MWRVYATGAGFWYIVAMEEDTSGVGNAVNRLCLFCARFFFNERFCRIRSDGISRNVVSHVGTHPLCGYTFSTAAHLKQ